MLVMEEDGCIWREIILMFWFYWLETSYYYNIIYYGAHCCQFWM
jgi:hypothetical protein